MGGRRLHLQLAIYYLFCVCTIEALETRNMLPESLVPPEEVSAVRFGMNVLVLISYNLGCMWNDRHYRENERILSDLAAKATAASQAKSTFLAVMSVCVCVHARARCWNTQVRGSDCSHVIFWVWSPFTSRLCHHALIVRSHANTMHSHAVCGLQCTCPENESTC